MSSISFRSHSRVNRAIDREEIELVADLEPEVVVQRLLGELGETFVVDLENLGPGRWRRHLCGHRQRSDDEQSDATTPIRRRTRQAEIRSVAA